MEKDFGTPVSDFPKGLEKFSKNISKRLPKSNLHNMYELVLTDLDGNKETYYGCNIMTDYFFKSYGYGGSYIPDSTSYHLYIGDGIDASHQPNVGNSVMYHNLTTTFKSETSSSNYSPMKYDSVSGDIIDTVKIFTTVFDYNISGISEPVVCNEIGFGRQYNQLFSHSKIYDSNGNEKTITKNPNQSLTVTLYWRISVNKTLFESLWNQGIYGLFSPRFFLWYNKYSAYKKLGIRLSKPGSISMNKYYDNGSWDGYYTNSEYLIFYYNPSYSVAQTQINGTVEYDSTNHTETWTTSSVKDSNMKWLMEGRQSDFFSVIEFSDNSYVNDCYYASEGTFYFMKQYKMSEYEDIEAYIKTDRFDDSKFYEVLGINTMYYSKRGINLFNVSTLRGKLPVTDLNIQSLYRYNFDTNDWDIPVAYDNPYNNDYERNQWFQSVYLWIKPPGETTAKEMYVFTNPFANNVTCPVNIKGFYNGGTVNYCTDEWWDTSTWETIVDYTTLPQSQQNKKYYITSWTYSGHGNSGDVYNISQNFRWWRPKFEYVNGLHQLQNIPAKELVDNVNFKNIDGMDYIISNEAADFYVCNTMNGSNTYNNVTIKKVSENVEVDLSDIIKRNFITYFPNAASRLTYIYTGSIYMDNGRYIRYVMSYEDNESGYYSHYTYPSDFSFFVLDLSQPSSDIESTLTLVKLENVFSPSITQPATNSKVFKVGSKYLGIMPMTIVDTGYECAIYDTELNSTWVIPDKLPETIAPVYGRNEIIAAPGGDLTSFTVYDVSTQTIVDQFTIPSDYSIDTNMIFAFDDYVYIRCTYGTNKVLLLYTRTSNTLESITLPDELSSKRYSFGTFSTNEYSGGDVMIDKSRPIWHANVTCQYKDGIVLMSITSNTSYDNNADHPMLIFSKYNPSNIILQKFQLDVRSSYGSIDNGMYNCRINGMCLKKMYGSYYGFIQTYYSNNSYYNATLLLDIGRIVRNNKAITQNSGIDDVDTLCIDRDGAAYDNHSPGYYLYCKYIPFGDYIYARNSYYLGENKTYKLKFDTFITYKIHLKTKTCTRWNNPKLITLPIVTISITNHV